MKKNREVGTKLASHLTHLTLKTNQNIKTEESKNRSDFNRLFRQVRRGVLQLLVGSKATDRLEESFQEYQRLLKYTPTNVLESHMMQSSDIRDHLATLYMLTVELDLKTVLELGTAEGKSTVALLHAAHQIAGRVYSIDIHPCQEAHEIIKKFGLLDRWSFMQGDDLQVPWDKRIDHLFIDTSHKFEHTLQELHKYEPHVRDGGIITMHDLISFSDVMHAIAEYVKDRSDLRLYKYFHNNGLAVIFKAQRKYYSLSHG